MGERLGGARVVLVNSTRERLFCYSQVYCETADAECGPFFREHTGFVEAGIRAQVCAVAKGAPLPDKCLLYLCSYIYVDQPAPKGGSSGADGPEAERPLAESPVMQVPASQAKKTLKQFAGRPCLILRVRLQGTRTKQVPGFGVFSCPADGIHPRQHWQAGGRSLCTWALPTGRFDVVAEATTERRITFTLATKAQVDMVSRHDALCSGQFAYEEVFQNERRKYLSGGVRFSGTNLWTNDPPKWTTRDGRNVRPMELFELPSPAWTWVNDWVVDMNPPYTDKKGWMYALNWSGPWKPNAFSTSQVRRRRWTRLRRLVSPSEANVSLRNSLVQGLVAQRKRASLLKAPLQSTAEFTDRFWEEADDRGRLALVQQHFEMLKTQTLAEEQRGRMVQSMVYRCYRESMQGLLLQL